MSTVLHLKQFTSPARDGSGRVARAHAIICDCGGDSWHMFIVRRAECCGGKDALHAQCLDCETTFCMDKIAQAEEAVNGA